MVSPSPLNWLPIAALMKDDGLGSRAVGRGQPVRSRDAQKNISHLERTESKELEHRQFFPGIRTTVFQGRDGDFCDPAYTWLVRAVICSQQR